MLHVVATKGWRGLRRVSSVSVSVRDHPKPLETMFFFSFFYTQISFYWLQTDSTRPDDVHTWCATMCFEPMIVLLNLLSVLFAFLVGNNIDFNDNKTMTCCFDISFTFVGGGVLREKVGGGQVTGRRALRWQERKTADT